MADQDIGYESATRDVLLPAAHVLGSECVDPGLAFSKCKNKNAEPEACIKLGAVVLECQTRVLRKILTKCPAEFEAYRKCMDKTQMSWTACSSEEKTFTDAFDA
eukprot:g8075.t1